MGDQADPSDGARPDLTTPELLADTGEQAEVIEVVTEAETAQPNQVVVDLPDDPSAAVPLLIEALGDSRRETAEYLDTMQRIAAEFDNFRKRSVREREEIVERASQRLIERLLPTLDSFDAALTYAAQTETEANLLSGMADTHRLLMEALSVDGFEPIEANDVPFDPAVHEAVTGPGEGEGELLVSEMRRGYTMRGRVVRAALVAVRHA